MSTKKHSCNISVKGFAIAGALFWGIYLFILALLAGWGIRFMWISKELVEWLSTTLYPGYALGFSGAIIGLFYGLVCGAICGGLIAWLHNKFCGTK